MQNWYCLTHFPDGSESVHLVPGPAPVYGNPLVELLGRPGLWRVTEHSVRDPRSRSDFAAEIWVRPAAYEELVSTQGRLGELIG